jgi:5-methylcytosine-specific restriction endonuclease McrA
MHENILAAAARLSDDALFERMKLLVGREREAIVELVADLAELLGRTTYLGEGWGPLFTYCRDQLHLSGDAAYNRVAAARAVRQFPVILDQLAAGHVTVTTVKLLRPVLTAQNHLAVLAEAKYRSKLEVERIVARLDPKPDVPSTIRKLPPPATVTAPVAKQPEQCATSLAPREVLAPPTRHPVVAPLAPERYRVQFTISEETHAKLGRVRDLLCREVPDGDPAAIFDRALDALLHEVEKKKLGATTAPRKPRKARKGSRSIPAHVRRAVWKRDGGRCAFEGTKGRCTERRYLEWHHIRPHADQGPPMIDNISLRCRAHNVYESELVFGRFDPSVVRETRENYAVSREIAPFQNGGSANGEVDDQESVIGPEAALDPGAQRLNAFGGPALVDPRNRQVRAHGATPSEASFRPDIGQRAQPAH